jgi:integrase
MKKTFSTHDVRIVSNRDLSKKWYLIYYPNGKRKRVYGKINSFSTFDARMVAAEALKKEIEREYQPPAATDAERLVQHLETKKGIWRKKTYQTYNSKLSIFLDYVGERPLTEDLVLSFFHQLAQKRHKITYNSYRQHLKQLCKGIGKAGLFDQLEKLKASSTPARYFQKHQRTRLKEKISSVDPTLWMFCQCVYYLFLRPNSELRNMKAGDFEIDRARVRVRPEISKNGKHEFIAIPKAFHEELARYLYRFGPSDYIFPGTFDASKPIGVNTLPGRHRAILRELSFNSEYKLYSWKHTGAIACVEAGIHPKILQLQLRHSTLEMTDRYLRQLGIKDLGPIENLFPQI